jgi:hypothetical protein
MASLSRPTSTLDGTTTVNNFSSQTSIAPVGASVQELNSAALIGIAIAFLAASDYPEKLIEQADDQARMSTFQRDELLTQSKILDKETSPPAKEAAQHSKAEPDEAKHGHDL